MENELLTKGKEFNIEIISDKNNTYSIQFTLNSSLEIVANQKNAILNNRQYHGYYWKNIKEG